MRKLVSYQLNQCKRAVIIYYAILFAILALVNIAVFIFGGRSGDVVSNSTGVVSFVFGIVLFKQFFNFFQQNGVSRNSEINSYALFTIVLAAILSICDYIFMQTSMLFSGTMTSNIIDIFGAYGIGETTYFYRSIFILVWHFVNYAILLLLGHFIALLYYRLSKLFRIIVSVAIPLIFLTLVSYSSKIGMLGEFIGLTLKFMFGKNYFINGVLPMVGVFVIIFFVNKMMIKGAEVR